MDIDPEKGRIGKDVKLTRAQQLDLMKKLKDKGYSKSAIAFIMRIDEKDIRERLRPRG